VHHPNEINAHHIVRRTGDHTVDSLAHALLREIPEGSLLKEPLDKLPMVYQHHWPKASADSFALRAEVA
jgi:hypothetical protein